MVRLLGRAWAVGPASYCKISSAHHAIFSVYLGHARAHDKHRRTFDVGKLIIMLEDDVMSRDLEKM